MSTLDPALRANLNSTVSNHRGYRAGVYASSSASESAHNKQPGTSNYARTSQTIARSTSRNEVTTAPNRRSNSPSFNLAQQPSPALSVVSYRRLGMPRGDLLPEFMRIDMTNSQPEIKLDTLPERMKLLDLFMANFANQFNGSNYPKSPPAPRSITSQSPDPQLRRSYTDIEEASRAMLTSASLQPSEGQNSNNVMKRISTPTIASQNKRRQPRSQTKQQDRPGSFVRSKTFDASLLENEFAQTTPHLAAAIVTLTRKDKNIPLTFSGDPRTPAPSLFSREIPELWSTINPHPGNTHSPTPRQDSAAGKSIKLHFLMNSATCTREAPPEKQNLPVETVNVANIKRLLQANKVNILSQAEQSKLLNRSNTVVPAVDTRIALVRSRSMSPVLSRAAERRLLLSPKPSSSLAKSLSSPSTNDNRPASPAKPEIVTQQSRENSSLPDGRSDSRFERATSTPLREKSTKTVRFQLVEDVRFYTPWSVSPLIESAGQSNESTETGGSKTEDSKSENLTNEQAQKETNAP